MESKRAPVLELTASIGGDNQLNLTFRDENDKSVLLRAGTSAEDLRSFFGEAQSFTVEVCDFYQYGTVYEIYGANLAREGRSIDVHWESFGRGRRHIFTVTSANKELPRFLIGASPKSPGAPVPSLFRSWSSGGGGLPDPPSKPKGGDGFIDDNNRLQVTFETIGQDGPVLTVQDLIAELNTSGSLALEVKDFYQYGTLYDVYGATISEDGLKVVTHWATTPQGTQNVFEKPAALRFMIGAVPRQAGAPSPAPFLSWAATSGG